jgi:hypothetical protein
MSKLTKALALTAGDHANVDSAEDVDIAILKLEILEILREFPLVFLVAIDQALEAREQKKPPRPRG